MAIEWIKHEGGQPPVLSQHQKIHIQLEGIIPSTTGTYFVEDFSWTWDNEKCPAYGDVIFYALADKTTVKSDGGSSDYYKITIRNEQGEEFHCETNDVLYALVGGDFDMANIIKACRRMYEASQGRGKQGTDIAYDVKKIKYFADDFAKRFGNA